MGFSDFIGALTGAALAVSGATADAQDYKCDVSKDETPPCETAEALSDAHDAQDASREDD